MTKNQFIFVLIVTFIVIVIWVVADIIHTKPSVPLDPKLESLIQPINPNFDKAVLDQIEQNQIPIFIEAGVEQKEQSATSSSPIRR